MSCKGKGEERVVHKLFDFLASTPGYSGYSLFSKLSSFRRALADLAKSSKVLPVRSVSAFRQLVQRIRKVAEQPDFRIFTAL